MKNETSLPSSPRSPWAGSWLVMAAAVMGALSFAAPARAQIVTVSGGVADSLTGLAIEGALVTLRGNGYAQNSTSKSDGSFGFTKVTPGTYTLSARRLGFAPLEIRVPIEDNGVQLNLRLVRLILLDTVRARTGTGIAGDVGAFRSARPIGDADVQVVGVGRRLRTDSLGRFYMPLTTPGTYIVRVRQKGYAPQMAAVRVPRDSTVRVNLLLDTTTAGANNAYEIAWAEFAERARLRSTRGVIVSHEELAATGEAGLLEALQRAPTAIAKQLRFGRSVCIFVDGRPSASLIRNWDVDDVEAVEVYPINAASHETETLRRASRGYECHPTELPDASVAEIYRIRWLVIWTKP